MIRVIKLRNPGCHAIMTEGSAFGAGIS